MQDARGNGATGRDALADADPNCGRISGVGVARLISATTSPDPPWRVLVLPAACGDLKLMPSERLRAGYPTTTPVGNRAAK